MEVRHGDGTTEFGPGVMIELSGDEIAIAVDAYLVAHGVSVSGPRTVRVKGTQIDDGHVYVDPCGSVVVHGTRLTGRGETE